MPANSRWDLIRRLRVKHVTRQCTGCFWSMRHHCKVCSTLSRWRQTKPLPLESATCKHLTADEFIPRFILRLKWIRATTRSWRVQEHAFIWFLFHTCTEHAL